MLTNVETRSTSKISKNVSKKTFNSSSLSSYSTINTNRSSKKLLKGTKESLLRTKRSTTKTPPTTSKSSENARRESVPRDAAAHFGNFYGLQEGTQKKSSKLYPYTGSNDTSHLRNSSRSEFTRQMLHKLEKSAGTSDYARQVSALLEETVEPPSFSINPLPSENSIPEGRHNSTGFPLWYKDPYKMPIRALNEYRDIKEKFGQLNIDPRAFREALDELTSENEYENESDDESESADDEESIADYEVEYGYGESTSTSSKETSKESDSSEDSDEDDKEEEEEKEKTR